MKKSLYTKWKRKSAPGIVDLPEGWESERGIVALLVAWARGPGIVDSQVRIGLATL